METFSDKAESVLGIADYLKVGAKIQYKTLEMQTFQHLFLNIPFNVMLALFKIGDESIKEVPAIHCFAAGKRQESRHLFLEDLPLSHPCQVLAWHSRFSDCRTSHLHLHQWLFLAWARGMFHV